MNHCSNYFKTINKDNIRTCHLAQSLIYKLKRELFSNFPITSEQDKIIFLSIINEKDIDSEKLTEYVLNLKSCWNELGELIYLTNNEISDYLLYSFNFLEIKVIFNISFKNMFSLLTNLSKENISKIEQKFYSNQVNSVKSFDEISWLNLNTNKVSYQLKNRHYLDILMFEKNIFQDRCLYLNINKVSTEIFEFLETFFLNHNDFLKVQIYISDDIKKNSSKDVFIDILLEKIISIIFEELSGCSTIDFFYVIINNNLKYLLSDKNFFLLNSIIKKNKPNLEILKIDGFNFSEEDKSSLCKSIIDYTYFDNLKIVILNENFNEEQIERFNFYFNNSRIHLYLLINDYEKINF